MENQRHLFDIPDDISYFNTAANAPQLLSVAESLHRGVDSKNHPWNRLQDDYLEDADTVRKLASGLFGGRQEDFAIVPSSSFGMSSATHALREVLSAGDRVVLMDGDFPSVTLPFQRLAHDIGIQLDIVSQPEDDNWTAAILNKLHAKTKALAIASCHWTNGAYIDLEKVSRRCKEIGTVLALDLTQTLGVIPFSFDKIQPDFAVASGYKWLLCPYGFSLFYVAPTWQNSRPLDESWLNRVSPFDHKAVFENPLSYAPGARRFDIGEKSVPTLLPGAISALGQLQKWGIPAIANTLAKINETLITALSDAGLAIAHRYERYPHMFGVKIPNSLTIDIVSELAKSKAYVSKRGNYIRVAPHLHISPSDIDNLVNSLTNLSLKG